MSAVSAGEEGVRIAVQVQPRASRTEVVGISGGFLKIRVAAPPVDGAANSELIQWLGKQLSVRKSDIRIMSGERGRKKVIYVHGVTVSTVNERLGLA
jgi:uncharacterized protein